MGTDYVRMKKSELITEVERLRAQLEVQLGGESRQSRAMGLEPPGSHHIPLDEISGRALAERELQRHVEVAERRTAQMQAVIDSMPDAVYFGDESSITHCNRAGLELLGVSSVDELNRRIREIGRRLAIRWPGTGKLLRPHELPFRRALAGETAIENVLATRLDTGEKIYLRAAAAPVRHNGAIVGAVAINSDMTDRVRAEQEIDRERRSFQRLAENSPDIISRYDREGRCIYVSPGAESAIGMAPQDLIGKTNRELGIPEELCQAWEEAFEQLFKSREPVRIEFAFDGPHGKRHYLSALVPEFNEAGEVESALGITHDITIHKEHEQELMRAKDASDRHLAQLQAVLRSIDQGLVISDLNGNIRSMNPRGLSLYGMRSPTECRMHVAELRSRYELFTMQGERLPLRRWPLTRAFNGETFSNIELEVRPLDGRPAWIGSFSGTPVRNRVGSVILAIVTFSDITLQKRDEAQLRELNNRLEELVEERTGVANQRAAQLRLLASQLTQAEQQELRRLAQVLHDHLQQLLVAAKIQVGILQADVREESTVKSLQHISDLINESISASRSLTVDLSPPILHDRGLLPALEWLSRFMEDRHGLKVDLEIEDSLEPSIEEVRILLFQIVRELLFNIVKHAGVSRARMQVEVLPGDMLQIAVSDEGRGFDVSVLQENDSLSGGFGLSSTRQRLELVGGMMTLTSAPNHGTRVQLRAPLHAAADHQRLPQALPRPKLLQSTQAVRQAINSYTARHSGSHDEAGDQPPVRVLLADDHEMVRDGLAQILRREEDIEVVGEASDGISAVEMSRSLNPDVVIMDVNMPGMNGIAATHQISTGQPNVRVIALSMHEEADMAAAMLEAGAEVYLTKGGPADALVAAVRNVASKG